MHFCRTNYARVSSRASSRGNNIVNVSSNNYSREYNKVKVYSANNAREYNIVNACSTNNVEEHSVVEQLGSVHIATQCNRILHKQLLLHILSTDYRGFD